MKPWTNHYESLCMWK